jgi:hypothetical protein
VNLLEKIINWVLGKNAAVSPLLLMLLSAVAAMVVLYLLRRRPLITAQEELRGVSRFTEAQVIRDFFNQRRGIWWQAVLAWVMMSFLSIALVPELLK